MPHVSDQTWNELTAANEGRIDAEKALPEVKAKWTTAKDAKEGATQALLEGFDAAKAARKDNGYDSETADRLDALDDDFRKTSEEFDLIDRRKRRLEDQAKKLRLAVIDLWTKASDEQLVEQAAKPDPDAWRKVALVLLVGELVAAPFGELKIATVGDYLKLRKGLEAKVTSGVFNAANVAHMDGVVKGFMSRRSVGRSWPRDLTDYGVGGDAEPVLPEKSKRSEEAGEGAEGGDFVPDPNENPDADTGTGAPKGEKKLPDTVMPNIWAGTTFASHSRDEKLGNDLVSQADWLTNEGYGTPEMLFSAIAERVERLGDVPAKHRQWVVEVNDKGWRWIGSLIVKYLEVPGAVLNKNNAPVLGYLRALVQDAPKTWEALWGKQLAGMLRKLIATATVAQATGKEPKKSKGHAKEKKRRR